MGAGNLNSVTDLKTTTAGNRKIKKNRNTELGRAGMLR
jgi:hypothetical protein